MVLWGVPPQVADWNRTGYLAGLKGDSPDSCPYRVYKTSFGFWSPAPYEWRQGYEAGRRMASAREVAFLRAQLEKDRRRRHLGREIRTKKNELRKLEELTRREVVIIFDTSTTVWKGVLPSLASDLEAIEDRKREISKLESELRLSS